MAFPLDSPDLNLPQHLLEYLKREKVKLTWTEQELWKKAEIMWVIQFNIRPPALYSKHRLFISNWNAQFYTDGTFFYAIVLTANSTFSR